MSLRRPILTLCLHCGQRGVRPDGPSAGWCGACGATPDRPASGVPVETTYFVRQVVRTRSEASRVVRAHLRHVTTHGPVEADPSPSLDPPAP